MTATQLMAELTQLGIQLEARGDRLGYFPRSAVTQDLAAQMKTHKIELLATLRDDGEPRLAIPLVEPDEIDADGWPFDAHPWPAPWEPALRGPSLRAGNLAASTEARGPSGACDRCGGTQYHDVPIHGGQSARRDCARCGQTHGFPLWYGINHTNDDG